MRWVLVLASTFCNFSPEMVNTKTTQADREAVNIGNFFAELKRRRVYNVAVG